MKKIDTRAAALLASSLLMLNACGGSGSSDSSSSSAATSSSSSSVSSVSSSSSSNSSSGSVYSVGGTASGVGGVGLSLNNNGVNTLSVGTNGAFVFTASLANGASYNVSIASSPAGQLCSVSNGSGLINGSNVTNIAVSCAAPVAGGGNQYGSGPDPIASPTGHPGSSDLISAAVSAGSLTREQALLYYLYAEYDDARLPAQYRGDDTGIIEGRAHDLVVSYIAEVGLANVSTATINALKPFFIPAYLEGSYTLASNATSQATARTSIQSVKPLGVVKFGWSSVAGTNVVVWYETSRETTDLPMATMLVNEMDGTIWPKLTTLMGRSPKFDVGSVLWTETDGRLDITLEDMPKGKEGRTIPEDWVSKDTAVHIMLDRKLSYSGLIAQAAHELMHAIQYSINVKASDVLKYATIREATASWASYYVYPKNGWETKYAQYYLKGTQLANAYDNPGNTNDVDNDNFRYGAYVFPMYLETQFTAKIVKDIWDKTVSESLELDAINQAIKANGSTFADQWRKFIPWCWNQENVNDLTRLYAASGVAFITRPDDHAKDIEQDYAVTVTNGFGGANHTVDLPRASMAFYRVTFAGTNVRSMTFLNGLTYKLDTFDSGVGNGFRFTGDTADNIEGASVQLYLKVNGTWQSAAIDMTNIPWFPVCRDNPAGKIEEMIFMYGNAEVDRGKPNFTSLKTRGDIEPGLAATDIACRDWTGNLSMSRPATQGVGTETFKLNNVTLTNISDTSAPTPAMPAAPYVLAAGDSFQPPFGFIYRVSAGTAVWNYSAHQSAPADVCDWAGSESTNIAGTIPLVTFSSYTPPGNTFRSVIISPLSTNQLLTTINWSSSWTCTSSNGTRTQGKLPGNAPIMDIVVDELNQAVRIKNNGTSVSGTGVQTDGFSTYGDVTGTWSFTAIP